MAFTVSRKEYSKKDINFFEEFTSSARKQAQVLAAVVFIGVIAIGLCLAMLAFNLVRNATISKEIANLEATLQSEEYAGLELKAQNLQAEKNSKNLYFYTLSEMRKIVDSAPVAETTLVNLISDCIPSSAYVSEYEVTGSALSISGFTFSYYDAANMCNLLNNSDVFSDIPVLTVSRDNTLASMNVADITYMDIYYNFQIQGNLNRDVIVTTGYFANTDSGVIALDGLKTDSFAIGSTYEYTGIATLESAGVTYTLSSVSINGVAVSNEDLNSIIGNNVITGIATENTDISLYYSVAQTTDGGEA